MARWEDVLDTQLDVHRYLTSDHGMLYSASWFEGVQMAYKAAAERGEAIDQGTAWETPDEAYEMGARWAQHIGVSVFNAEPIWVEPDMMTLIEAAVEKFKPEPLQETDLITPEGLLVLPRSLSVDAGSNPTGYRRMTWRLAHWVATENGTKVMVTLFHDSADPDDFDPDVLAAWEAEHGKHIDLSKVTKYVPMQVANWSFGSNYPMTTGVVGDASRSYQSASGARASGVTFDVQDVQQQLQAIWRLLSQTLAVHVKSRPPRQIAKRAARANLPHEHVTVVRLRRFAPARESDGEPNPVNWTHRWIVGSHWRWQWYRNDTQEGPCGHLDNDGHVCMAHGGRHKQIWIGAFQKGPEHLPLVVNKHRVFIFEQ